MKDTKIIMGMPITVEIVDEATADDLNTVFIYLEQIDKKYSPYKKDSELSKINAGLAKKYWSKEMTAVMRLCEETKRLTKGYFNIQNNDKIDTSGLVKGWAIYNSYKLLKKRGLKNFYIEAGGDIQVLGENSDNRPWAVGIRNPFNIDEIIKVIKVKNKGVATSGTYIRGDHIYNPNSNNKEVNTVKSLTVIGPNIYEADRFATAAFAMGQQGIGFIESLDGFEGYMVDDKKTATLTSGFLNYVA